jgi:hypothetical protein
MNHREPPHPTAGVRRARLCLALLLPAVLAPAGAHAALRPKAALKADQNAYLPAIAAPALRFQAPALPREQVARITFTKPAPKPESAPALPKADATARAAPAAPATEAKDAGEKTATRPAVTASARPPAQIIPDDTRGAVQAEDFIPFFQLPGSARSPGGLNVIVPLPTPAAVPTPGALPPSSATFRQTP